VDQHDLVSALKQVAVELGKTPTRREFTERVPGGHAYERLFGSYSALIQAAGLDPIDRKQPKISNAIFQRDIEKHLEDYQPKPLPERKPYPSLAVISDVHWPFENRKVIEKFLDYVEKHKPRWVIINGDAWDMYSHSKYPRSHNVFTPREEQALARKRNEEFWCEVRKRSPQSQCVQMMGNHDVRPLKRVLEVYPAAEDWISQKLQELFTFDGVKTIMDAREELFVSEDVIVFHGYRSQLGAHRDYTLYSCINGHTHVGGVVWRQIRGGTLFEANSGVAGDPYSKGLNYTPQKITHWTPGFLGMDDYGPRFIPV
jgi:predicted phosphodiesterase